MFPRRRACGPLHAYAGISPAAKFDDEDPLFIG
jgi:hypothetical protein